MFLSIVVPSLYLLLFVLFICYLVQFQSWVLLKSEQMFGGVAQIHDDISLFVILFLRIRELITMCMDCKPKCSK